MRQGRRARSPCDMSHPSAWHRPWRMGGNDLDQAFGAHRRVLLDVAYRLLGSVADAEDAVQEAFARLARERVDAIADLRAWLVVVVSRICLDQLGSARA